MKKLILLILLTFPVLVNAGIRKYSAYELLTNPMLVMQSVYPADYYVSADGSDLADGSYATPFATLQKAIDVSVPGDTTYVMDIGGVFYPVASIVIDPYDSISSRGFTRGVCGTAENRICYFNYPGQAPIFDFINVPVRPGEANGWQTGIQLIDVGFIHLKGLTLRNILQKRDFIEVTAVDIWDGANNTFENITVHDIGGVGFKNIGDYIETFGYDTVRFINCDAYNCFDIYPKNTGAVGDAGNYADGFFGNCSPGGYMYIDGCRAWNCSDDGFDFTGTQLTIYKNNWSMSNGEGTGDGTGFKIGGIYPPTLPVGYYDSTWVNIIVYNNIAVFNVIPGDISTGNAYQHYENYEFARNNARIYNNVAYGNRNGFTHNWDDAKPYMLSHYYNNLSFDNISSDMWTGNHPGIVESNNSFDYLIGTGWLDSDTITVTTADFIGGLDSLSMMSQMTAPRQSNGKLPYITAWRLEPTSDLNGAGRQIPIWDSVDFVMSANPAIGVDWEYFDRTYGAGSSSSRRFALSKNGKWTISKRGALLRSGVAAIVPPSTNIIANHTIVDDYDIIPQRWIDSVKTMLVTSAGMSHSKGYYIGPELLEQYDARFRVLTSVDVEPVPLASDTALTIARPWMSGETLWTNQTWRDIVMNVNGQILRYDANNPYDAWIFGWSYQATWTDAPGGTIDPVYNVHWAGQTDGGEDGSKRWGLDAGDSILTGNRVSVDTYLDTWEQYIAFCEANFPTTHMVFSTLIVDGHAGTEAGFQRELKSQHIRDYINANSGKILFDFGDILTHNNAGQAYTSAWDDNGTLRYHPQIHPDNLMDYDASWNIIEWTDTDGDHIGEVGALRLGKALWWMLARMAGWDGNP